MIEFAKTQDKTELTEIFNESFPGENKFAEWLFDGIWRAENTLILRHENEIKSALQLLPQEISCDGNILSAYYIHSVGTRKAERSKGYAGKLLRSASSFAAERKIDAVFLIPAEKSLFEYYKKFGYENYFYISEKIIVRKPLEDKFKIDNNAANYLSEMAFIYNNNMQCRNYVLRNEADFKMLLEVYGKNNAYVLLENNKPIAYAFCEKIGDKCRVSEAMGENASILAQSLGDVIRTPANQQPQPLGMAIDLSGKLNKSKMLPYCNLLFN